MIVSPKKSPVYLTSSCTPASTVGVFSRILTSTRILRLFMYQVPQLRSALSYARALKKAAVGNYRVLCKQASALVSRDHLLSFIDQGVVSGTSFLSTLLVARFSNAGELGVYAIGISLLASLIAFQDSLILQPYTIQLHSRRGTAAEHSGSSLLLSFLFSAASVLVLIAAAGLLEWTSHPELVVIAWAIASVVPFLLAREFVRRTAFARLEVGQALVLDAALAALQLAALGWLGLSGRMSAPLACAALGAASAVTVVGWLYWKRREFTVSLRHLRGVFSLTWALGKWLVVGRITVQVQGYITYWITLFVAGASVTGVYAACMSIVNFANPALFALGNVLTAKLVLAWRTEGGPGLRREAIRNAVMIGSLMTAFSLAILLGGAQLMHLLFHGKEFEGQGQTVTVLALAVSAGAIGMPASFGLATIGRPRAIVIVGTIGALLSILLIWLFIVKWGLLGAAYGLLAGSLVGSVGRWIAFSKLLPPPCDATLVRQVLQHSTGIYDPDGIKITWVGGGEQAEVFRIDSNGQESGLLEHKTLVAKIYRPEAALTVAMVDAQFNSLSRLHKAIHGFQSDGWTISVPRPLYVCKLPLAFVMTSVPGQFIDSCASDDAVPTSEALQGAARAFAAALETCWAAGTRHGDLGLRNVLFDLDGKMVSFIDAGTAESCRTCSGPTKFQPAASDLAHVLCDVAKDVTDLIGDTSRMGRELFVETVLRTVMQNVDSAGERETLLTEVQHCLQEHLAECLELGWSVKGVSHRVVKQVAVSRVRSIIDRVAAEHALQQPQLQHLPQLG